MKSKNSIKQNLDYISQIEGDSFEFKLDDIENEYLKLQGSRSGLGIKILSIVGGLLAMSTFTAFILITGIFDSEIAVIAFGLIFIIVALYLNVKSNKSYIGTFSIAIFCSGLFVLVLGLSERIDEEQIGYVIILISLISIRITQNYLLSFIFILLITGSTIFIILVNDISNAIHLYNSALLCCLTYSTLNEARLISHSKIISRIYNPLRIALIISTLVGLVIAGHLGNLGFSTEYIWTSSIITIPLTLYVISIIVKTVGITQGRSVVVIYILSTLFLIPTAISPAISGALLITLLSFLVNYKLGLSIGIVSFVYFISQYYYDLSFTLLTKSIALFTSGVIFLLLYYFTHKKLTLDEKA